MLQSEITVAPRVLIVEDDAQVAKTFTTFLERQGLRTAWAPNGARALELKTSFRPDVVLLDLQLPDLNGVSLIRGWSGDKECGIIVVSGECDPTERVAGLELGADDYVMKPPGLRELTARIRALHRRLRASAEPAREPAPREVLRVGSYTVDLRRHSVIDSDGVPVELTGAEFAALRCLLENAGQPVSRDSLSQVALRRPWQPEDRGVDQLICGIRQKLRAGENDNSPIRSIRGAGYLVKCSA